MTRDLLAEVGGETNFRLDWVPTYADALAAMKQCAHDVYLLDYRLGAETGLDLLREAMAGGCKAPMILLTGQGDEAVDMEAMRAGAADYLIKGEVDALLLDRSIRYALERHKAEQMKDRLLAFASHELRTPVTVIRGYAETILLEDRAELGDSAIEHLGNIIQAADHLTRLIDGFLDLSRIEAGRPIELAPEDFAVCDMVAEAVAIATMAAKHCEFAVYCDEDVATLHGDRYKLLLVLVNLLSNADKYWPEGGVVEVRVTREDGHVRFAVTDRGVGIPAEALETVFAPFYRVRGAGTREVTGAGIGLCLSRHLVEAHGGRIWMDSELGSGTTVYFTLPG